MLELHAVTDGTKPVNELIRIILSISEHVDYVHIREKNKRPCEIIHLVEQLLAKGIRREQLVINDRLDVALLTGVQNVHLPGTGLPIKKVKSAFPQIKAGVSVHSLDEAVKAEKDGADYCFFGNVFETNSKKGLPAKGTDLLGKIVGHVNIPIIAIGGITPDNMQKVLEKKASGIAVMSYIFSSKDPESAAKLFRKGEAFSNERF
ncbi:thiazole tautomerase TenI [Aeribacillus composti]|jgi:thiazole tautomerase (transcriptional regulator TenI)|nr:thiazole tautomerase TenI [Aeribacillus composti]MED0745363.1 thiazole tautomerase TenI [Aeribacillus composti]